MRPRPGIRALSVFLVPINPEEDRNSPVHRQDQGIQQAEWIFSLDRSDDAAGDMHFPDAD